jgi:translation initiation factor IF-3
MTRNEALSEARKKDLYLVLVSDNPKAPTCNIIDYWKFLYEQKKKDNEQRKKVHKVEIKWIRLSLKIWENDLQTKLKQSIWFLEEKNIVKISMSFRWRELGYTEMWAEKIEKFCKDLEEYWKKDWEIKRQWRQISITLSPKKKNN